MKSQGRNFGLPIVLVSIGAVIAAGAGRKNTLSLEAIPNELAGSPVTVRGIIVKHPKVAATVPTSKSLDGVSVYQLFGESSFAVADKCPQHKAKGTRTLWNALDGYTLGTLLSFTSGKPFFLGGGRSSDSHNGTAAASDATTEMKELLTRMARGGVKRSEDFPQWLGPFAAADGTSTLAFETRPVFYLPIGEAASEKRGKQSVPAGWLNGKKGASCAGQDAAKLEITLPSKMDDLDLTWTTSGDEGRFELFAVVQLNDARKIPCPTMFSIDELEPGANAQRVVCPVGMVEFLAAMKRLTSAGVMSAHSYTRLELELNGDQVMHDIMAEQVYASALALDEDEGWTLLHSDDERANGAPATRRANACVPLFMHRGSNLHALGSDQPGALQVRIVTTGETSHRFVCGYRQIKTDALRQSAEEWARGLGGTCGGETPVVRLEASTDNGNTVPPAMDALLPGVVRIASASAVKAAAEKIPG